MMQGGPKASRPPVSRNGAWRLRPTARGATRRPLELSQQLLVGLLKLGHVVAHRLQRLGDLGEMRFGIVSGLPTLVGESLRVVRRGEDEGASRSAETLASP